MSETSEGSRQRTEPRFDLLADLASDARELVERYLGRTQFTRGSYVMREGEHDRAVYLLREGTVEIVRERDGADKGEGQVVNILEAPNVFGEVAFFDGSPRSGSVRAQTDGMMDRISYESFATLARERPDITMALALALGRLVGQRLRAIENR